jgi:hypothetical protein
MREECRLRVFKNRVLRRIFGHKRDEVTGEWGRLHNEELYVLYSFLNIIRVIKAKKTEMDRACSMYRGEDREYMVLLGKPEKRPLGRPRCKWKMILKWIFRGVGRRHMDWIDLI